MKLLKAELLLNGGKLEEAQWLLSTIADADELETIIDVVFLYLDMGYPDAAKEWLDRGKSRYAEDEEYMALTADYLASTHQVESAIIYYNKLIDKSPFNPSYWMGLVKCYFVQEQIDKAIEACDFAMLEQVVRRFRIPPPPINSGRSRFMRSAPLPSPFSAKTGAL